MGFGSNILEMILMILPKGEQFRQEGLCLFLGHGRELVFAID
jgi:hypothetical protein